MEIRTDYLVIGSGIAGLSFSLQAAKTGTVAIVTKKKKMDTSTNFAQGGIASVFNLDDSFDLHIKDTLESGVGLCDEAVVRMVVEDGPDRIRELISLGVNFSRQENNREDLELGMEGGHSRRRIVHTKDKTGQEVERSLLKRVEENNGISIISEIKPDIVALGYDQYTNVSSLEEHFANKGLETKIVRLEKRDADGLCSSTLIRKRIIDYYRENGTPR